MRKRKHGEYILIHWDSEAPYELVFGHVTEAEALAAIATEHGEAEVARWGTPKLTHGYGRWNVSAGWSEFSQMFEEVDGPGRGRFKVTYVEWKD